MAESVAEDALYKLMEIEYKLQCDLSELNYMGAAIQRKKLIKDYLLEVSKEPNLPSVNFECNWEMIQLNILKKYCVFQLTQFQKFSSTKVKK